MQVIRRGDRGHAVVEIRAILDHAAAAARPIRAARRRTPSTTRAVERAVRAFQQARGLTVTGDVNEETWRALDAARWPLGSRVLAPRATRAAVRRRRPAAAGAAARDGLRPRPRRRHLRPPHRRARSPSSSARSASSPTASAARRPWPRCAGSAARSSAAGRTCCARPSAFRAAGPALVDKRIVIDPGHGGGDPGVDRARRSAAVDRGRHRLRPRRPAGGPAGRRRHAGPPHPRSVAERAAHRVRPGLAGQRARRRPAHLDPPRRPRQPGRRPASPRTTTASTATAASRRRSASGWPRWCSARSSSRTGLRDCQTHAKTWDLLRLTRMPAVRVEVGYLTSPRGPATG